MNDLQHMSQQKLKYLFSQADIVDHPNHGRVGVQMYEYLVTGEHHLPRIHTYHRVLDMFMARDRNIDWDKNEEQDMEEFLQIKSW